MSYTECSPILIQFKFVMFSSLCCKLAFLLFAKKNFIGSARGNMQKYFFRFRLEKSKKQASFSEVLRQVVTVRFLLPC